MQIPRRALHGDMDDGAVSVDAAGGKLVAERADGDGEIVGDDGGRAQVLNRIAALGDGLRRAIDRALECLLRFGRTLREHVDRGLKAEQHAVKALQQRIVQLARDARALVDALVQAQIEFVRDPADAELVRGPQQRETRHREQGLEPGRLVVRRRDR